MTFLSKKVRILGRGVPVLAIVIMGAVLVSAALIAYFGQITGSVTVTQGLYVDGQDYNSALTYSADMTSFEKLQTTSGHNLTDNSGSDAVVNIVPVCTSSVTNDCTGIDTSIDTVGLSTTVAEITDADASAVLNSGGVVSLLANKNDGSKSSEARITIDGADVGVNTLSQLSTVSWHVDNGVGYAPHLDVYLDVNKDGVWTKGDDDVLVFEVAKMDNTNCDDNSTYPIGTFITSIGGTSYAWLDSGIAGDCSTPDFQSSYDSLANWKTKVSDTTTYNYDGIVARTETINGDTPVLRMELEVDGWGQMHDETQLSSADVSNVEVNGNAVTMSELTNPVTVPAHGSQPFYINSVFPKLLTPETYTITTTVNPTP